MKLVQMGNIAETLVENICRSLDYVEKDVLNGVIKEHLPSVGLIIEATKNELMNNPDLAGCMYREVEVAKKKGE